jgi:tetratricopeptide (TPR) repeat protein
VAVMLMLAVSACQRSPQHYLETGNKLAAQNKYDEADLNYRKAIQRDPGFGQAYLQLGLMEIRRKHTAQAYQWFAQADRTMPDRDDVAVQFADLGLDLYLGDSHHPRVLHDKINAVADKLLAKDVNSFDGLRLKGHLAAADKDFQQADDFYRRANAVKPMQHQVVLAWTEVLLQNDRPRDAEDLASQLIDHDKTFAPIYQVMYRYYTQKNRLADAEKILKTQIANNPTDAGAILQLAAFYGGASREADMRGVLQQMLDRPKDFPTAHVQIGDLYRQMRRWNDALAQFQAGAQAASADPRKAKERIVYLKRITELWLVQGKTEQAYQSAGEVLRLDPGDTAAQQVKASLLLSTRNPGNVATAVSLFRSLVAKEPENPTLHFDLGRGLVAQGNADAARAEFQTAIRLRPGFVEPRVALVSLMQSKSDYKATLEFANQALAINPGLSAIRLARAVALIHVGDEPQGRSELNHLEREFPQNHEVQLQLAMMDLHDRKFREAEDHFRKLSEGSPGDIRPLKGLTDALAAENEFDNALAFLQESLRKTPNDLRLRSLLASTAVLAGKYDLGIEQYRQLLAAAPKSTTVPLALSRVYRTKGDLPTAVDFAQKARAAAPASAAALVNLGDVLSLSGRQAEALDIYRQTLKLQRDNAAALSGAAYAIAETGGNLDEAFSMAQQAVRLDSLQPGYSDTLGWVYLKKNFKDSALQVFRSLTEKYPDDPMYHYHLGLVLLEDGDRGTAKTELKSALSMNPPVQLRQKIEGSLAKAGG